ncbi:MAG TPA: TolC family protein [Kiritimatiellia bacterium]|nr:TolC family protein [Kiritimatiellia bacterium]HRZ11828.1 TolC family protein [Kiritimatiellia bacterium]HSA17366.1 TolC family protein [Kiritimatiellia bacterium]
MKNGWTCLAWLALAASAAAEPMTWEACVRRAAALNPTLVAAREQFSAAEFNVGSAKSASRPQLSLGGSAEHAEQDGVASGGDASMSVSASAEQTLYTGGRNAASVDAARAALDSARADYERADAEVTYNLRRAFVNLLLAQEQVEVLRQIEQRRRDNLELVNLRYEGGREHKGSLALIQASLNQAEIQVRQGQREVEAARRILLRTMGEERADDTLTVSGSLTCRPAPDSVDWQAEAEGTPAYAQALASTRSAEAGVRSARSGYRPDISLSATAGRSGNEDVFDTDRWAAGVRLSFPLWSGGRTRYEVASARASLARAEAQESETVNGLINDLNESWVSYCNAVENVVVQESYFAAADLRAEIAREQYGAGLLTFENWDVIENDRISYQRQLLQSQQQALLAEAAWRYVTGRGDFPAENEVSR